MEVYNVLATVIGRYGTL